MLKNWMCVAVCSDSEKSDARDLIGDVVIDREDCQDTIRKKEAFHPP